MTSHCKANNIKGIRQAGRAGWEALVVYAMTVPGIPASGLELLGLPVRNARQREAKKALEALCQDACKKIRSRDLQLTVRANQQRNSTDAAAGVIRAADGGIVAPHVGSPPQICRKPAFGCCLLLILRITIAILPQMLIPDLSPYNQSDGGNGTLGHNTELVLFYKAKAWKKSIEESKARFLLDGLLELSMAA
ncbi:hypothetical protein BDZ91DRAFT_768903 [Kalaharituber pfeilii]|nr:hypothetical protein BDZ91DRAFT_768903 [Kalaharituber pfeilii]